MMRQQFLFNGGRIKEEDGVDVPLVVLVIVPSGQVS